jgi:hypothetical protein
MRRAGRPFEVMALLWSTESAILAGTGAPVPPAIAAALPVWGVVGWYGLLGAGGAAGLAAVFMRHWAYALLVEEGAMFAVGAAMLIYAVCAFEVAGWGALAAVTFLAAWGAACAWRIVQIELELREIRRLQQRTRRET